MDETICSVAGGKPFEGMVHVPLGNGGALVEARFLARPNRFLVEAELDGAVVQAHLADRGRLKETLFPGARLLLARQAGVGRKTAFQAVAAYRPVLSNELKVLRSESFVTGSDAVHSPLTTHHSPLTSLDTHLPNRLIEAALRAGALPQFVDYPHIRREVTVGASRFDFQLTDGEFRCTVEVKSAGYVEDGVAWFPDAPTARGRRHLDELAVLAREGERAAVVFVAQGAAQSVALNRVIDPEFAAALHEAAAAAVEIYAFACPLSWDGITLGNGIPVQF